MVRFQCDSCGKLKQRNEIWILGLAAENVGITSAWRELSIASAWEDRLAVDPLAVHLCSEKCRSGYTITLFGDSPDTLGGEATLPKKRIQRVRAGSVVDTVVSEKAGPAIGPAKRKKTA